jgi:hypothetical protein
LPMATAGLCRIAVTFRLPASLVIDDRLQFESQACPKQPYSS